MSTSIISRKKIPLRALISPAEAVKGIMDEKEVGDMPESKEQFALIEDIIQHESFKLESWDTIDFDHLDQWIERILDDAVYHAYLEYFCFEKHLPLKQVINHLEKAIIIWALFKHDGSLKRSALFLDIEPATLARKMARYSIQLQGFKR